LIICKFFGSDESGENCNTEIKRKKKKKIFKKSSELSHNGSVRRSEYSNGASRDSYRGKNLQELPISYVKKKKNKKELPISYEEKKKNKKLGNRISICGCHKLFIRLIFLSFSSQLYARRGFHPK
jgi:hypothetical protein